MSYILASLYNVSVVMAERIFLINRQNPQLRIAELHGGKLDNLDVERSHSELGSIFWGKVSNVVAGMDAAFVDIGQRRNGLLHLRDIHWTASSEKRSTGIKAGQPLLVQIARPSVGEKGPRLTTRISLPGRYIVLTFPSDGVGVSQKIEAQAERNRLKNLAERIRPLDYGIIVRTEAEGATLVDLEQDLSNLLNQLNNLKHTMSEKTAPVCLHQDLGILGKVVRDRLSNDVSEVLIDDVHQFTACQSLVRVFAPHLNSRIKLYGNQTPIFQAFNIEKDFLRALQPVVNLPHGGSLIIEETEALTVIDVNTARFTGKESLAETVLQTNLEAVAESTLQMRLRNLGGIVVIDFIDMARTKDRIQVLNALEVALNRDRVKTHIVQLSPSGLVEITRRREGLSLSELMFSTCSSCRGTGKVKSPETTAIDIRQRLRGIVKYPGHTFVITMHPTVAVAMLGNEMGYIEELEQVTSGRFVVRVDKDLNLESFQIEAVSTESGAEQILNQRYTVSPHDPLYPAAKPQFGMLDNYLVMLPECTPISEKSPNVERITVLEILKVGRWFATAQMLQNPDMEPTVFP